MKNNPLKMPPTARLQSTGWFRCVIRNAIVGTCFAGFLSGCGNESQKTVDHNVVPMASPQETAAFQAMTKEAYQFKKDGHNSKALEKFKEAARLVDPVSMLYASSLDDQASVMVRLGKYDEGEKLFRQSIDMLKKVRGNPQLLEAVEDRLQLLQELKKRKIQCAEPEAPDPNGTLPYFPNIEAYQVALGALTDKVAVCKDSNVIEAMTTRVVATGDGRLVYVEAKDHFKGTDTEKCVAAKIAEAFPTTALPRFAACYRGFTYPFMLGNHQNAQNPAPSSAAAPTDNTIPSENTEKGATPPATESFMAGAQKLLATYVAGSPEDAKSFFFPADAFNIVKDSPNPAGYYKKLMQWYEEDIALEKERFKEGNWKVTDVTLGNCKWKAPGTEANKIGYWSCSRNTVSVQDGEKQRRFEIQVLINWGKNWYITHLRPVRN